MIFFLTLPVGVPFYWKDFKWKKYGGTGLISEKMLAFYVELNKNAEAASSSYSETGDILQYIYNIFILRLWLKIIARSDQVV